jgi:hypothetical protein
MGKGLEFQINQHNKRVRQELHKRLLAMDATHFEQFVGHHMLADLRAEAARPNAVPIALMNGEQCVALLADKKIGIIRNSHDILELAADDDLPSATVISGS